MIEPGLFLGTNNCCLATQAFSLQPLIPAHYYWLKITSPNVTLFLVSQVA